MGIQGLSPYCRKLAGDQLETEANCLWVTLSSLWGPELTLWALGALQPCLGERGVLEAQCSLDVGQDWPINWCPLPCRSQHRERWYQEGQQPSAAAALEQ